MLEIRKALPEDNDQIWGIIKEVISRGDTYAFDPNTPKEKMLAYWCGSDKHTFVATEGGAVVGTFVIKDNQPGHGSHVANASFMVSEKASGKGIGKDMGLYSLEEAKRLGYLAMQFNIVVKSNVKAVGLWKKLGFQIVGEVPDAFNHKEQGLTAIYIMHRRL